METGSVTPEWFVGTAILAVAPAHPNIAHVEVYDEDAQTIGKLPVEAYTFGSRVTLTCEEGETLHMTEPNKRVPICYQFRHDVPNYFTLYVRPYDAELHNLRESYLANSFVPATQGLEDMLEVLRSGAPKEPAEGERSAVLPKAPEGKGPETGGPEGEGYETKGNAFFNWYFFGLWAYASIEWGVSLI